MNKTRAGTKFRGMKRGKAAMSALGLIALTACCSSVPESVKLYAADLPARADGQYSVLEDPLKKGLVMKDSELQCKIDLEEGSTEEKSAACRCSKSSSEDWIADCKDWLGKHAPSLPASTPTPAAIAEPTASPPSPATPPTTPIP